MFGECVSQASSSISPNSFGKGIGGIGVKSNSSACPGVQVCVMLYAHVYADVYVLFVQSEIDLLNVTTTTMFVKKKNQLGMDFATDLGFQHWWQCCHSPRAQLDHSLHTSAPQIFFPRFLQSVSLDDRVVACLGGFIKFIAYNANRIMLLQ